MPRDDPSTSRANMLRWPDLIHLTAGIWLGFSPWLLGFFDDTPAATWNALAAGGVVIVLAAIDIESPARWQPGLLALVGLWLILSPLALGYGGDRVATYAALATGLAVFALACRMLLAGSRARR